MEERVLGFTGTRSIACREEELIQWLMKMKTDYWLLSFDRFVTGACEGWDAFIGRYLAANFLDTPQAVLVPWNRTQVDVWWEEPEFYDAVKSGMVEIVYMPVGTNYRYRNEQIIERATELHYCADYPEAHANSKRSGTWMTKRIAERKHIPITGIVLNKGEA